MPGTRVDKEATFNLMQELGIDKVIAEFSGGNDEGYIEKPVSYCNGAEVGFGYNQQWGTLEELVSRPIYDEYGGFDDEFSVDGRVTWDLNAGTVKITGQEGSTQYEDIEKEFG